MSEDKTEKESKRRSWKDLGAEEIIELKAVRPLEPLPGRYVMPQNTGEPQGIGAKRPPEPTPTIVKPPEQRPGNPAVIPVIDPIRPLEPEPTVQKWKKDLVRKSND